jgi:hypothetical protein
MSENDDAVLNAAVGYVFVAEPGTPAPTPAALKTLNLKNPASWAATGWDSTGHTSRATLPEFGYEGGDSEVKGSWQKKKLKEITTEDPIDFATIILHQFDEGSLGLYYGPNASATPGMFGVDTSQTNEKAVFIVIVSGETRLGHWVPRSNAKRDDSIDLPIDDLAALPVKFTYLDFEDLLPFYWINEDLFNAVVSLPHLALGGGTAGSFKLKIDGVELATGINVSGISTATIKAALVAPDDGIDASEVTVTAAGGGYDIDIPAVLTLGTDSTTGGTGVTLA